MILALIYYGCAGLYTLAITISMPCRVKHVRAVLLWPLFWTVLLYRGLRGRHGRA